MTNTHTTREAWLTEAIEMLAPFFIERTGIEEMPKVRVSVGWPGGSGRKNSVIGQCWAPGAAADGVAQVFISPVLADAGRVLDVLVHELIHAIDENQSGHRGRFRKMALAMGLEGKMTATVAGDELKQDLAVIAAMLGEYPHAALKHSDAKKQSTRMLNVECAEGSGYKARMTRKWLEEYGAPKCPCHDETMAIG